ncbi:MAG: glycoside hydrolase family 32 protein, partial [Bacteroidota bacterium]
FFPVAVAFCAVLFSCDEGNEQETESEVSRAAFLPVDSTYANPYRPQFHFSPRSQWMNDPNGMVYFQGEYHLFYQYYPDSTVWGPMHWGHAVSRDLVHWEHLPIALNPDSLGYIFSGSAVVDWKNTTGFGSVNEPPLIAIYTYHHPETTLQTQAIAYSTDRGRNWTKYDHNPVLPNSGIKDFRDPKVFWHEPSSQWIMILAEASQVGLYGSLDLKSWEPLSKFGQYDGNHGGVWECPDLFQLSDAGVNSRWVMIVSIGSGGPAGGSASQYFIGDFDGKEFRNDYGADQEMWLDYGKDNYAGVTWSDVDPNDGRRIFLGWMSNWQYATKVPTESWRSAMTLPREMVLYQTREGYRVASRPVQEVYQLRIDTTVVNSKLLSGSADWSEVYPSDSTLLNFELTLSDVSNTGFGWELLFENELEEYISLGFDQESNQFFIDRTESGDHSFSEDFSGIQYAKRISGQSQMSLSIWIDRSSIEVFADNGTVVMTDLFFPTLPFDRWTLESGDQSLAVEGRIHQLSSIW